MSTTTLVELKERLALYTTAEAAVLKSQSYTIKDRTLTRADLREIRRAIKDLRAEIERLERGGGIRLSRVIPRDL